MDDYSDYDLDLTPNNKTINYKSFSVPLFITNFTVTIHNVLKSYVRGINLTKQTQLVSGVLTHLK